MLNLAGELKNTNANGPGLRYTIFTQGCSHTPHCKGCHNEYLKFLQFITEHFDVGSYEPNKIHKWIADLVIVVGTSLAVSPFNSLLEWGYPLTKKVLINKTQTENYFSLFDLVFLEDAIDFINRIEDEIKYEQKI